LSGQENFIGLIVSFEVSPESSTINSLNLEIAGQVSESYVIPEGITITRNGTFSYSDDGEMNEYELDGEFSDSTSATLNVVVQKLNGQRISLNGGEVELLWLESE